MPAAPTATVFPSLLTVFPSLINATDCPDSSPAVSPSMSAANSPQRSYGIHLRRPMPLSAEAIALMRSWGRAGERLVGGWPSRGRCQVAAAWFSTRIHGGQPTVSEFSSPACVSQGPLPLCLNGTSTSHLLMVNLWGSWPEAPAGRAFPGSIDPHHHAALGFEQGFSKHRTELPCQPTQEAGAT